MTKVLKILILILSFHSISFADQKNLDQLFQKLKIENNQNIAQNIEDQIWKLWTTHQNDNSLTQMMSYGTVLMNNRNYEEANRIFTKIINTDPTWAEGWNKRATVYYYQKKYKLSQLDINKVIELENRHFGALSGQGMVQIKLDNLEKALESYKKVLEIYPSNKAAQTLVDEIEQTIKEETI
tara:strand:+ start:709 stop:1254 length:546 start_codon:yes stop_codon:yes gene_type:complete